ncbi:GNAT family N-acetyltransferase [Streptomyces ovatisporus]|uniref:GNAT family N-acetyltransferase n=1 Tax=Streptomyces ovatisporus TaxID=1128682 RepID=A0ABV9A2P4_9ACTN
MRIEQVAWEHPDAVALRARQRAEIAERYGTPDSEPGTAPSAVDIRVFSVAYADGDGEYGARAVGCGGVRDLGDGVGEIKRMYVDPPWRGSGTALLLLRALEDWAREQGWRSLRLETGDRQPDAVRFYTRSGYERIPNFGAYAGLERSWCFERSLHDPPARHAPPRDPRGSRRRDAV